MDTLPNDAGMSVPRIAHPRPDQLRILAPTALEYWAVRSMLPTANVTWTGVKLARQPETTAERAVTCGLAGGLKRELAPGTVVIPNWVGLADGQLDCDQQLVGALTAGARSLGFEPDPGPLVTTPALVTGPDREYWSRRGFTAVDMETGLLAKRGLRVATVRVILDSPDRGIAEEWVRPRHAVLRSSLWGEFWWLCRAAPWYSLRAARVLRAGLQLLREE